MMKTEDYQEKLFLFFEEYADFLAHMVADEEEKLQALLSNTLPRIERAISTAQANAKQMENMELKRQRMQELAGYAEMSFSEIIECAPDEEKQSLEALFWRIQGYVDDIKFHNSKSMRVARANMMEIDPEAQYPDAGAYAPSVPSGMQRSSTAAANDVYMRAREKAQGRRSSLLETKI